MRLEQFQQIMRQHFQVTDDASSVTGSNEADKKLSITAEKVTELFRTRHVDQMEGADVEKLVRELCRKDVAHGPTPDKREATKKMPSPSQKDAYRAPPMPRSMAETLAGIGNSSWMTEQESRLEGLLTSHPHLSGNVNFNLESKPSMSGTSTSTPVVTSDPDGPSPSKSATIFSPSAAKMLLSLPTPLDSVKEQWTSKKTEWKTTVGSGGPKAEKRAMTKEELAQADEVRRTKEATDKADKVLEQTSSVAFELLDDSTASAALSFAKAFYSFNKFKEEATGGRGSGEAMLGHAADAAAELAGMAELTKTAALLKVAPKASAFCNEYEKYRRLQGKSDVSPDVLNKQKEALQNAFNATAQEILSVPMSSAVSVMEKEGMKVTRDTEIQFLQENGIDVVTPEQEAVIRGALTIAMNEPDDIAGTYHGIKNVLESYRRAEQEVRHEAGQQEKKMKTSSGGDKHSTSLGGATIAANSPFATPLGRKLEQLKESQEQTQSRSSIVNFISGVGYSVYNWVTTPAPSSGRSTSVTSNSDSGSSSRSSVVPSPSTVKFVHVKNHPLSRIRTQTESRSTTPTTAETTPTTAETTPTTAEATPTTAEATPTITATTSTTAASSKVTDSNSHSHTEAAEEALDHDDPFSGGY